MAERTHVLDGYLESLEVLKVRFLGTEINLLFYKSLRDGRVCQRVEKDPISRDNIFFLDFLLLDFTSLSRVILLWGRL